MEHTWEAHKDTMRDLFICQKLPLKRVIEVMKLEYGFDRQKAQYERRFREWGLRKNMTRNERSFIRGIIEKQKEDSSNTEFHFNGELVSMARLQRISARLRARPDFIPLEEIRNQVAPTMPPSSITIRPALTSDLPETSRLLENLPCVRFRKALESNESSEPDLLSLAFNAMSILDEGLLTVATWDMMFPRRRYDLYQLLLSVIVTTAPINASKNAASLWSWLTTIYPEELAADITTKCTAPSIKPHTHAAHFHLLVYLLSNSMLEPSDCRDILAYVESCIEENALKIMLSSKSFAVQALSENLLLLSVMHGRQRIAQTCLESGANVRVFDDGDNTLLQSATTRNDVAMVRLLLKHGADVDATNREMTPLQLACKNGNIELAQLFLDAGADINQIAGHRGRENIYPTTKQRGRLKKNDWEWASKSGLSRLPYSCTALDSAAIGGHLEILTMLLKAGAECSSNEVLASAIFGGNRQIVEIILNLGIPIDAPGTSPICIAALTDNLELVQKFLGLGACINSTVMLGIVRVSHTSIWPCSVIEAASLAGSPTMIKMLIKAGPRLTRSMALPIVAERRLPELVTLYLNSGADLYAKNGFSENAMTFAILDADLGLIFEYIKFGKRNSFVEATALSNALIRNEFRVVKVFLDSGFEVNAVGKISHYDPYLVTPLTAAVRSRNDEMLDMILKAGADIKFSQEHSDIDPLNVAVQENNIDMVIRLLSLGADVNIQQIYGVTPLHSAASLGNLSMVKTLLRYGANVNPHLYSTANAIRVLSPLAKAACRGHVETVKTLLQAGADANAPAYSFYGQTPLQATLCAPSSMNVEIIDLLIDSGADVNAKAAEVRGFTALQAASISCCVGVVVKLLEYGANVNAVGAVRKGRTALEGASEQGRIDTVQLLLNAGAGYDPDGLGIPQYKKALRLARKRGHMAIHDLIKDHFQGPT